jgi:hypothetical protein
MYAKEQEIMRRFKFLGKSKTHHKSYLIRFQVGETYDEGRVCFKDGPLTIQDAAEMYPQDWELVENPDDRMERISIEIFKVLVAKNYDPVCGMVNSGEDLARLSKKLSKILIDELNEKI